MTKGATIGRLRALKRAVLEDGRVDWEETGRLLDLVRPLAARRGILFQDYERLLVKCREDGRITKEESDRLALQLDFLCGCLSNQRLRFWLVGTLVLLLAVAAFAVGVRVFETAEHVTVEMGSPAAPPEI